MLITPRVSEKSYQLAAANTYVFEVPLSANKVSVIAAIEQQYDGVKVRDARLLVTKGKPKSAARGKRSRPVTAYRKTTKKAYVTLAEGKIDIAAFSEIDNQTKAEVETANQPKAAPRAESQEKDAETKQAGLFARKRTGRRGDK